MNMDEQQLPPGWVEAKIDELLPPLADGKTMHQGWSPRCDGGPASSDDEWAVLKTTSIQDGEFKPQHNKKIPAHLPPRPRLEVKTGDLLITSAGPRIRCGVPCLVRQTRPRLMISGKMYRFRAPQELDSVYFESVLRSPLLQKAIDEIKTGIDESGLNLTHERFRDLTIPIPPLPEQRRIVDKIEALQERSGRAAKALEEVGPLLEQFRQSILAAAFSGRLTADWRAKNPLSTEIGGEGQGEGERKGIEPAHELLNRIRTERRQRWEQSEFAKYEAKGKQPPKDWKDKYEEPEPVDETNLPELPEGWCWATIETTSFVTKLAGFEYTEFVKYDPNGDLAVIKAENAGRFGFRYTSFSRVHSGTVEHLTRSRVKAGDVLMVFVGAGVGQVACVPADQEYFLGPNIAMIRIESPFLRSLYLEHFLRSPVGFDLAMSFTKAVAQPSLSMGTIRQIPVPIPPMSEQKEIEGLLEAAIRRIGTIESDRTASETELTHLNQSILAKAFRGELVPQDPNDEPASELLARIRREREQEVSGGRVQGSGRKKKAGGKTNAPESARPAKRSKRSSKAASSTTPDASADTSPEPARPQRRRRRSSSNNVDPSLVIRVLAEGDGMNIHADTSGPTVQFYTKSSGGGLLAEIEDIPEAELKPRESKRVANLSDLMEPDLALLHPVDVNETYLPQLRNWYTWAAPQLPEDIKQDFLQQAQERWVDALELSDFPGKAAKQRRPSTGRLFENE